MNCKLAGYVCNTDKGYRKPNNTKSTKSYEDKVETQKRGQPDKTLKVGLRRRLSR